MPVEVVQNPENELVFKFFHAAIPTQLKDKTNLEGIEAIQDSPNKADEDFKMLATNIAKDAAFSIARKGAEYFLPGPVLAVGKILLSGFFKEEKDESSKYYLELDYLQQKTDYPANTSIPGINDMVANIHNAIFRYQTGKDARYLQKNEAGKIEDHRYLIIALIEFLNRKIVESPNSDQCDLYIQTLKNFILKIQENEQLPPSNRKVALLSTISNDTQTISLAQTLNKVNEAILGYSLQQKNTIHTLKTKIEALNIKFRSLTDDFEYLLLNITTSFEQIPQDFIKVAINEFDSNKSLNDYKTILDSDLYKQYVKSYFVEPRQSLNKPGQQSISFEALFEYFSKIEGKAFPYFKENYENIARVLAFLLNLKNDFIKFSDQLKNLCKDIENDELSNLIKQQNLYKKFEYLKTLILNAVKDLGQLYRVTDGILINAVKMRSERLYTHQVIKALQNKLGVMQSDLTKWINKRRNFSPFILNQALEEMYVDANAIANLILAVQYQEAELKPIEKMHHALEESTNAAQDSTNMTVSWLMNEVEQYSERLIQKENEIITLKEQLLENVDNKSFEQNNSCTDAEMNHLATQKVTLNPIIEELTKKNTEIIDNFSPINDLYKKYTLPGGLIYKLNDLLTNTNLLTDKTINEIEKFCKNYQIACFLETTFSNFLLRYQSQKKSVFFWARHGETGRVVAANAIKIWAKFTPKSLIEIFEKTDNLNEQSVHDLLLKALDNLINTAANILEDYPSGNLHRHSAKTYIIAYVKMLEEAKDDLLKNDESQSEINKILKTFDFSQATRDSKLEQFNNLFESYFTNKVSGEFAENAFTDKMYREREYARIKSSRI